MGKFLISILAFLTLVFLISQSYAFDYQQRINDTFSYAGKTVTLSNLNQNAVVLNISGEDRVPPFEINKPEKFGELTIILKSVFYSENKSESFAMIDFCQKTEETCNNIDDDCDGKTDEEIFRKCGNITTGICKNGAQKCINGEWGYCENIIIQQDEICNNLDDDCDGLIDENVTRPCGNSPLIGGCKNGFQKCINSTWDKCEGYVFSSNEKCNGIDDDCDGKIDEDLVQTCGESDKGICKLGKNECKNAAWEGCIGAVNPGKEICDGLDNDCDGNIDNNCESTGFFSKIKKWFSGIFG